MWYDILAPLDSPTYPLVHRIVSSAFGASCTSFQPALKSVHGTSVGAGRGHHWLASTLPHRPRSTAALVTSQRCAWACARARHLCCESWPPATVLSTTTATARPAIAADPPYAPRRSPRPHAAVTATHADPTFLPWPFAASLARGSPHRLLHCAQAANQLCHAMPCSALPLLGARHACATHRPSPRRYYAR